MPVEASDGLAAAWGPLPPVLALCHGPSPSSGAAVLRASRWESELAEPERGPVHPGDLRAAVRRGGPEEASRLWHLAMLLTDGASQ